MFSYNYVMNKINACFLVPFFLILFLSKQNPKISEGFRDYSDSINRFTFEIYSKIQEENQNNNLFISGYSIHNAIEMVYEGAIGKSAEEIEKVLYINPENKNRLAILKSLIEELNKEEKNKLLVANALWVQKDYKILKDYLNIIEKYYFGKANNLDFAKDPENSRKIINDWVEKKTSNKIKDLIPEGCLNSSIKMVLTNAIYFKGNWLLKFDENLTKEEDFRTENKEVVKAEMMRTKGKEFYYGEDERFQVLEMDYEGESLSMVFLLPKNGDLNISYDTFKELKNRLNKQKVDVFIPKFKFEKKYFINSVLNDLGIKSAFSNLADLSGITGKKDLKISDVIHQSFIQVDEKGTEAAAATGITLRVTSVLIEKIPVFRADHPFIFFVQHKKTGVILFVGKVSNPKVS